MPRHWLHRNQNQKQQARVLSAFGTRACLAGKVPVLLKSLITFMALRTHCTICKAWVIHPLPTSAHLWAAPQYNPVTLTHSQFLMFWAPSDQHFQMESTHRHTEQANLSHQRFTRVNVFPPKNLLHWLIYSFIHSCKFCVSWDACQETWLILQQEWEKIILGLVVLPAPKSRCISLKDICRVTGMWERVAGNQQIGLRI